MGACGFRLCMEESGRVEQLKELSGRVFDVRFVFVRGLNLPVIDLDEQQVLGRIPMGWYPNSVSVTADGKRLYVVPQASLKRHSLRQRSRLPGRPSRKSLWSF